MRRSTLARRGIRSSLRRSVVSAGSIAVRTMRSPNTDAALLPFLFELPVQRSGTDAQALGRLGAIAFGCP